MISYKKPTLVFDYDGTIHNTMLIYEKAFRKCYEWLVENQYVQEEEISSELISSWLGMNVKDMWNSFQPNLSDEIKTQGSDLIGKEMLSGILNGQAKWYPNTEEVLEKLLTEGYNMVILSNCKTAYRDANWNTFKMNRFFKKFYDCESFGYAPKEDIIKTIRDDYSSPFIVIGDRNSDLKGARSIGASFIGCNYGYGTKEELSGSDAVIDSIVELPEIIKSLTNNLTND